MLHLCLTIKMNFEPEDPKLMSLPATCAEGLRSLITESKGAGQTCIPSNRV